MSLHLNSGFQLRDTELSGLQAAITNIVTRSIPTTGYSHQFMMWMSECQASLERYFDRESVHDLLVTPRALAVTSMEPPASGIIAGNAEQERVRGRLLAEHSRLVALYESWTARSGGGYTPVVADTNVFIHASEEFTTLDWHSVARGCPSYVPGRPIRLVIPMVVLYELDRLKFNSNTKTRARHAIQLLDGLLSAPSDRVELTGVPHTVGDGPVYVQILMDELPSQRLPLVDDEILLRALELQQYAGTGTVLATGDISMRLRAQLFGLECGAVEFPPR
jgi:PIN domain